jgi:hypothetical protein
LELLPLDDAVDALSYADPANLDQHWCHGMFIPRLLERVASSLFKKERSQDRQGSNSFRRSPSQLFRGLPRSFIEPVAALLARHHKVSITKIPTIEWKEPADARPVVVDETLRISIGIVIRWTVKKKLTAGTAPITGPAPA